VNDPINNNLRTFNLEQHPKATRSQPIFRREICKPFYIASQIMLQMFKRLVMRLSFESAEDL